IDQKKSIIYFSNGVSRSGIENQVQLRAATNAAVQANVALYTLDVRGLQAFPPGGEAQSASLPGRAAYSGQSVLDQFSSNADSQETLTTLAGDTGGKREHGAEDPCVENVRAAHGGDHERNR